MFNSMFDEYFKKIIRLNRFQESCNVKCYKEIKRSKSLQKAEAYLESKRAATMEFFC